MSEETENKGGFFSNLKNQIITGIGVILTTLGTVFMDEVKSLVGLGDDTEQVQGVQQNNQQSQQNSQQVIINIPEQKTAETKTIVKEVQVPAKPVEKKKEKEQEIDW
jgi:hypothetical protein